MHAEIHLNKHKHGESWVPVYPIHLPFLDGDQVAAGNNSEILPAPSHADVLALLFLASPIQMEKVQKHSAVYRVVILDKFNLGNMI